MKLDPKRIEKYLSRIVQEATDIEQILQRTDKDILSDTDQIKSLKYSVIIIAEAIAGTLQHILAKEHNAVVDGYMDVFVKSERFNLLSAQLISRLQPFIRFRNMLVHQYWRVDDTTFLSNLRQGLEDFRDFVKDIREAYGTDFD